MRFFKELFFSSNNPKEKDLPSQLEDHIMSLNLSVKESEKALVAVKENEGKLLVKIKSLSNQSADLYLSAERALKSGDEFSAENFLLERQQVEVQLKGVQKLYHEISHTVRQLEQTIAANNLKIDELNSKKVIVLSRLQTAQTAIEFQEQLNKMNADMGFDQLEEDLLHSEAKASALQELSSDVSALDLEIESALSKPSMSNLKAEIDKKEVEKQNRKEQEYKKLFDYIFEPTNKPLSTSENDLKSDLLAQLKSEKLKAPEDKREVDDFFTDNKTSNNNNQIDEFFKSDESEKQKKIDDFFNN